MEIHFTASDIDDPPLLTTFFLANKIIEDEIHGGQGKALIMEWSEPIQRSGIWDTLVEWTGKIDISSLPVGVAASLIANYLWHIIMHLRGEKRLKTTSPSEGKNEDKRREDAKKQPPFQSLSGAHVMIIDQGRQVEFDPLAINQNQLHTIISEFVALRNK